MGDYSGGLGGVRRSSRCGRKSWEGREGSGVPPREGREGLGGPPEKDWKCWQDALVGLLEGWKWLGVSP